ncbi:MAG: hypothetical protein ACRCXZ_04260 [Patescibacteria group bacterium]
MFKMKAFYKIRTNKKKNRSLDLTFFQFDNVPAQIIQDGNAHLLTLKPNEPVKIKVTNHQSRVVGICIRNGFYNLVSGASPKPNLNYESSLFEAPPKSSIWISNRCDNTITNTNSKPIVFTDYDEGNLLSFFVKYPYEVPLSEDSEYTFTTYKKRAQKLIELKIQFDQIKI